MTEAHKRICKYCGREFETYTSRGLYCSRRCANAMDNMKRKMQITGKDADTIKSEMKHQTRMPCSVGFNKNDLYAYKQRAIHSVKELGEISRIARSEHHETYGQYISHEQSLKSDHDMRIRHEVWKLNQEKAKEKKADEPISEGGKAVFKWVSHTKPKHTT